MRNRLILFLLALMLPLVPAGLAQDAGKPTIAILQFGPYIGNSNTIDSILGVLLGQGIISVDEFITVRNGNDLDGERINIIMSDAGYDFANEMLIVEDAIDRGATALVTLNAPTAAAAEIATSDMADPPVVIFAAVHFPFRAGIAQASCVKPDNLTGLSTSTPYADIVPLLRMQNPDIRVIGAVYSASESSGRFGAEEIVAAADELGISVLEAAVSNIADLGVAAEGLIEKGAEALLIPSDSTTIGGMPILEGVAIDNGIPIFHAVAHAVNDGATVSAGPASHAIEGGIVGIMLVGHLSGQVDIGATQISSIPAPLSIGINLDAAGLQDVQVSASLLDMAETIIVDGKLTGEWLTSGLDMLALEPEIKKRVIEQMQEFEAGDTNAVMPPELIAAMTSTAGAEASVAAGLAYVQSLHCTDEMIAEQMAALGAADG